MPEKIRRETAARLVSGGGLDVEKRLGGRSDGALESDDERVVGNGQPVRLDTLADLSHHVRRRAQERTLPDEMLRLAI